LKDIGRYSLLNGPLGKIKSNKNLLREIQGQNQLTSTSPKVLLSSNLSPTKNTLNDDHTGIIGESTFQHAGVVTSFDYDSKEFMPFLNERDKLGKLIGYHDRPNFQVTPGTLPNLNKIDEKYTVDVS
jgi:hypothetical protein